MSSSSILKGIRPWAFTQAELTAGLRSQAGDPWLYIVKIQERKLQNKYPSVGRIYGLHLTCSGAAGIKTYDLVIKEPYSAHRTGMAGAGPREVAFYSYLSDHLPIRVPRLFAAQRSGEWMALERLRAKREPEKWTSADYKLAAGQLAVLHDRFWGLDDHLGNYAWLIRPLENHLEVHLKPAFDGFQRLLDNWSNCLPAQDLRLMEALELLVKQSGQLSINLHQMPFTLLHGDYWPGNLCIGKDGRLAAYDWQGAAIGPGILDLAVLVFQSSWRFGPLPLPHEEIVTTYRTNLARLNGHTWGEDAWQELWDSALLWTFLTNWLPTIADIPKAVMKIRYPEIKEIWFDPVCLAISRQLSHH